MPFALIIIGLILIVSAARGTLRDLGELLKGDFTGPGNFFSWMIAIGIIGAVGHYSRAQAFSRAFLGLVLVVMILSNGGFLRKLVDGLQEIQVGGGSGSGPAGNTLDGAQGARAPASGAPAPGALPSLPGPLGSVSEVVKTVRNPSSIGSLIPRVLKRVPIIGGLF